MSRQLTVGQLLTGEYFEVCTDVAPKPLYRKININLENFLTKACYFNCTDACGFPVYIPEDTPIDIVHVTIEVDYDED